MIDVAERIERVCARHGAQPAISVGGALHDYDALHARVLAIHGLIDRVAARDEALIGVAVADDLDTYASILAVLRSGRAFVPLNPEHPVERNASIVNQAGLRTVLFSEDQHTLREATAAAATHVTSRATVPTAHETVAVRETDLAYLLFTSGSTGEPKGVPITRGNLAAFLDALAAAGCATGPRDRVLQMFDLTFDFSIATYLAPLSSGACVYTIPRGTMKFAEVYRLLDEEQLTVAPMVPSVLTYLQPYFDEINLPALRLSFFCGEALHADIATAWMRCAPASVLVNFYGPTEATVFAMYYDWRPADGNDKAMNGIVSIGQPMERTVALLVDGDLEPVTRAERGELCLAGPQVTPGYWQDAARNARSFFEHDVNGVRQRFYRTGDLAMVDAHGDFLFCGRVDHQVKVQGYRVELGEIEHHARDVVSGHACVVVPRSNMKGNMELWLVVEGYTGDLRSVLASLRERVPSYMVPARAISMERMPLNANGKIDRRAIADRLDSARG